MTWDFWTEGATVVRGRLPTETVDRIAAEIDGLLEDELADLSALAGDTVGPRFRAGVDHWRHHPELAALATSGPLPAIVAEVLDTSRLWLYEDSVLVKAPGSAVETKWHTDDGYFHVEGRQLATTWVPVDPAPRAAGTLRFLAGSHRAGARYRPTFFVTDDALPGTEGELPPDRPIDGDDGVLVADLELGDLSIHHSRTLHASPGNATQRPRRAWSIRYCGDDAVVRVKPGAPPKPGFDPALDGSPIDEVAERLGLLEAQIEGHADRGTRS